MRSIDLLQVPHDTNLWAQLECNGPNVNLDKALDIISYWHIPSMTQISEIARGTRTVAKFMRDNPEWKRDWKKKAFAKQSKSGHRVSEKLIQQRRCLVCDKKGPPRQRL